MTIAEIIRVYWPILALSFVVSLAATPLCRWFALKRGIVDKPDNFLKPHSKPVAYLGGVAIFLGWATGLGAAIIWLGQPTETGVRGPAWPGLDLTMMIGIFFGGLGVMLLGLFDDLRLAQPVAKLAGTALVAFLLMGVGLGGDTILVVVRTARVQLEDFSPWLVLVYSVPITLFMVIGACNATNLIDGLDGLCSGVLGIMAAGFAVLAIHLLMWHNGVYEVQLVVLSLAMLGASLGFLPYNRNPATIFMGDAGSMLLGLNAAIVLLLFTKLAALRWMLGAVMVFGLPLADMVLTLVRRWRNQRPLMQGDRSHYYDQLIDRKIPLRRVVAISYGLALFFGAMGCAAILLRTRYLIMLYTFVAGLLGLAVHRYRMVRLDDPEAELSGSGGTNSA